MLSVLGGGSQALAATCDPPTNLPAPAPQRVESATTSRGVETTEILGPGTYRVSRCTTSGRFLEGMTVGAIEDPKGRVVLVPLTVSTPARTASMLYAGASDPRWAASPGLSGGRSAPISTGSTTGPSATTTPRRWRSSPGIASGT